MFDLFTFISGLFVLKEIIQEMIEPVAPPEQHFDWDKYYSDCKIISSMAVVKRRQQGYYDTVKSQKELNFEHKCKHYQYEKYLKDKSENPEFAEAFNKCGGYGGYHF